MRYAGLFLLMVAEPLVGSNVQLLTQLPNSAVSKGIQLDSSGNIYLAGYFVPPAQKGPNDFRDAFVAKVSADGSQILYFKALGGSSSDAASALMVGADGSVYVTGSTSSIDFPTTAGAMQPKYGAAIIFPESPPAQTFLVKLDASGTIVYGSYLGGAAFSVGTGLTLDSAGNLLLTGNGGSGLPGTTGAVAGQLDGWVMKLDPALAKVLLVINGYGGGLIALDQQANIYIAGAESAGTVFGLTSLPAGGFQSSHAARFCFQSSGPSGFALNCSYQYVAKFDPAGTKLQWATYITGTYGAIAAGIAVDSQGNVSVAGTTNSDDYPVTPGAFQTAYMPATPPPPNGVPTVTAPPATGFVTRVNATGTALLWSTYFGGSYADHITGMSVTSAGDILISGRAGSTDFPVLAGTPDGCRPGANQVLGFVARMSADGKTAGPAQPIYGAPDCLYGNCNTQVNYQTGWPIAARSDGGAVAAGINGAVAAIDFASNSRMACVADPADNAQLRAVAPGQLLSIFGTDLASATPFIPTGAVTGLGVTFNGTPAPILYTSAQQINVQVPYEIAGASTVRLQVTGSQTTLPLSESRTLDVVARQPAALLAPAALLSIYPGYTVCGGTFGLGEAVVAVNADGTLNDCTNPAPAGSTVTIYVDGLGQVTPAQSTGAITPAPAVNIAPALSVTLPSTASVITATVPGVLSGITAAKVQLPAGIKGPVLSLRLSVGGVAMREQVLVWIRPSP